MIMDCENCVCLFPRQIDGKNYCGISGECVDGGMYKSDCQCKQITLWNGVVFEPQTREEE